jgi:hypothetical protein
MIRRLFIVLTVMLFAGTASQISAHKTFRIIGTIAKVSPTSLSVKQTKTGTTITMNMADETIVTRDKKTVTVTELKPGLSVVVDACGDSLKDLTVEEVRIVPALK